jgi:hypothetical protein
MPKFKVGDTVKVQSMEDFYQQYLNRKTSIEKLVYAAYKAKVLKKYKDIINKDLTIIQVMKLTGTVYYQLNDIEIVIPEHYLQQVKFNKPTW